MQTANNITLTITTTTTTTLSSPISSSEQYLMKSDQQYKQQTANSKQHVTSFSFSFSGIIMGDTGFVLTSFKKRWRLYSWKYLLRRYHIKINTTSHHHHHSIHWSKMVCQAGVIVNWVLYYCVFHQQKALCII